MSQKPLFLVDGYNFLHAVVLRGKERAHFWSAQNQERVLAFVGSLPTTASSGSCSMPASTTRSASLRPSGAVRCLYAPDADAHILELVEQHARTRRVVVVSADRSLCDRAL